MGRSGLEDRESWVRDLLDEIARPGRYDAKTIGLANQYGGWRVVVSRIRESAYADRLTSSILRLDQQQEQLLPMTRPAHYHHTTLLRLASPFLPERISRPRTAILKNRMKRPRANRQR